MLGFVGSNAAPRDAAICPSCSCWVLVVLLVVLASVLVVLEVVVLLRLLMFLVLFFAVRLAIC